MPSPRTLIAGILAGWILAGPIPAQDGSNDRLAIDVHNHLVSGPGRTGDYSEAVRAAISAMDRLGIRKVLVMPPPADSSSRYLFDLDLARAATDRHPGRFGYLMGGESLNPMIQDSVKAGTVSEELRRRFERTAEALLARGAIGFGEMTAEHFSLGEGHPYESAPPDHPLFLLLARIAARHDVPIDLHMEAIVEDGPLPPRLQSPPNPAVLRENIPAFERLLAHDRKARIVWAHAGSTLGMTPELVRRLLTDHSNLYLSLRFPVENAPRFRELQPEWARLIEAFPDRFVIGSDQFYRAAGTRKTFPDAHETTVAFVRDLSARTARKVAFENAVAIYRLGR